MYSHQVTVTVPPLPQFLATDCKMLSRRALTVLCRRAVAPRAPAVQVRLQTHAIARTQRATLTTTSMLARPTASDSASPSPSDLPTATEPLAPSAEVGSSPQKAPKKAPAGPPSDNPALEEIYGADLEAKLSEMPPHHRLTTMRLLLRRARYEQHLRFNTPWPYSESPSGVEDVKHKDQALAGLSHTKDGWSWGLLLWCAHAMSAPGGSWSKTLHRQRRVLAAEPPVPVSGPSKESAKMQRIKRHHLIRDDRRARKLVRVGDLEGDNAEAFMGQMFDELSDVLAGKLKEARAQLAKPVEPAAVAGEDGDKEAATPSGN